MNDRMHLQPTDAAPPSHSPAPGHPLAYSEHGHASDPPLIVNSAVKFVETLVFNVRWFLLLFYGGLVVVLALYGYAFVKKIVDQISMARAMSAEQLKVVVLDIVDMVMIANLLEMIISGSYHSFVSKLHAYKNKMVSSGMLKIKISTSVLVVCTIHLMANFVGDRTASWDVIGKQLAIFGFFMLCTLVLIVQEYMHIKGEALEKPGH